MMSDINKKLEKLEFHVKLLAEELSPAESPIATLVIGFNWSEEELDLAHDIFERYDQQLSNEENINWHAFETEFKEKLNVSYQRLKSVILSFYRNRQWEAVCCAYAMSFGDTVPFELKTIAREGAIGILSQQLNIETLGLYTKWKYPDMLVDEELQKIVVKDLDLNRYPTLEKIDEAVEYSKNAVNAYQKDNPEWFESGTDYITKSLGFADLEFRKRHHFGQKTKEAFLKYAHLIKKRL